MFDPLNKAYNSLTGIGISDDLPYIEKVKIRILNQCTWLVLIAAFLLFLQSRYLDRGDYVLEIVCICLFSFPIFLHLLKNYYLARITATIFFPVFILALAITYGPKSSVEFVYFASILTVLIMYDNKWLQALNILGIVFIFCTNFYYWENYDPIYPMKSSLFNDGVIFFSVTLAIASIILNFFKEHKENYQRQLNYNSTLADRNEKLEHYIAQNETKNQLIQIVAHDLKSPAASFLNLTQKISYLIRKEEPHRLMEIASHIEASGTKFFYTLDNLLNWVISQKEGITVQKNYIKLAPLLEDIEKDMAFLLEPKNLQVVATIPEDTIIFVDEDMMKIILKNVLHNAVKFSPPNEKILINYRLSNVFDKITISDLGQGMDKKTQRLIQQGDLYFSSEGTLNEKGHGLGLKICYRMISFLNGKIKVKSKKGEGCQISICIPRRADSSPIPRSEIVVEESNHRQQISDQ